MTSPGEGEVKVTVGTGGECPRCARQVLRREKTQNALSRADDKAYVCEACRAAV